MTNNGKMWYTSKTLWVNILFIVAYFALKVFNFEITADETAAFLIIINLILRAVTKTNLEWTS